MEKSTETDKTLGQAIDELIQALKPLDESSRVTAIRAACEHLRIPLPSNQPAAAPSPPQPTPNLGGSSIPETARVLDIKSLKDHKQPSSANEMAALVAYYLSEHAPENEGKPDVTFEDMVKYFKQAGFRLPRAIRQLLPNAKNAGYFDTLARGKYRLNPVGYNLVVHNLPRSRGDSKAPKPRKARRATKSKAKPKQ